jgi:hypothetical protein
MTLSKGMSELKSRVCSEECVDGASGTDVSGISMGRFHPGKSQISVKVGRSSDFSFHELCISSHRKSGAPAGLAGISPFLTFSASLHRRTVRQRLISAIRGPHQIGIVQTVPLERSVSLSADFVAQPAKSIHVCWFPGIDIPLILFRRNEAQSASERS